MKTMGTRIRAKREECGMTQDDLAKKLNISRQAIAKYESGEIKRINRDLINRMAVIFGCQPAWLMNLDDYLPPISLTTSISFPIIFYSSPQPVPNGH